MLTVSHFFLGIIHASPLLAGIRVHIICLQALVVSYVFKRMRWQTAETSMIIIGVSTIDKLLFRKCYVLALAQDIPMGLHGSNG